MKLVIVVPAFNESAVIYKVLNSLPKRLKVIKDIRVIAVDDGSTDETAIQALKAKVNVVRHPINRGLGAAIKTGLAWAKKQNADIIITFDSDGQHNPKDIPKLINPIITNNADLVIGSRFKKKQKVPLDRLFLNWSANVATLLLFGVFSTDSQSGLRAFSKKAANLIDFKGERMEFSSEIILEAKKHKLKIKEVATDSIYTSYSRQKGQKNINAVFILSKFLLKVLR